MRKTKLMVSAAALSMMAALALTGCGGGTSESAAADGGSAEGGNTITVWAWDVALKQLQSAAEKYNVVRVPTVVLEDDGVPFASCSGYQPAEILSLWVEAMLEEHSGDR